MKTRKIGPGPVRTARGAGAATGPRLRRGRLALGLLGSRRPGCANRAPLRRLLGRGALAARRRRGRRTGRHDGESTPNTTSAPCVTRRTGAVSRPGRSERQPALPTRRSANSESRASSSETWCRRPPRGVLRRLAQRQPEPEGAAHAELGADDDLAAVHLRDPAGDRQPEAGAGDRQRLGVAGAVEGGEQVDLVGGGDAEPGVGAQHPRVLALDADLEVDGAVRAAVLHRVAGQVVDDLAELVGVGGHRHRAGPGSSA